MRTRSKKPGKQRLYEYKISKHEVHKLMTAPVNRKIREEKGFKNLPVRVGDTVRIIRGGYKGRSGKVARTEPLKQRLYVDGVVMQKTDNTEIPVPIHPSNIVIDKYVEKDRYRLEMINRRIADEDQKIDVESVLAAALEEEEEVIEMEDDEFVDDDLLDTDLDEDDLEFEETEDLDEEEVEDLEEDDVSEDEEDLE